MPWTDLFTASLPLAMVYIAWQVVKAEIRRRY